MTVFRAHRSQSVLLALCVAILGSPLIQATGAAAATAMPFSKFFDMVVDDAHQHVFVTGGEPNDQIAVFDFSGALVGTISNEPGASGLALSGDTLYVALSTGNAIHKIDTGTLTDVGTFGIGSITHPLRLAIAGGRLWFTYGGCSISSDGATGIGSADLTVGLLHTYPPGLLPDACPILAASPSLPDVLFAWDLMTHQTELRKYQATDPPVLAASHVVSELPSPVVDVAVAPDGQHLLAVGEFTVTAWSFELSDLSRGGVDYPTTGGANAVETTSVGGGWVAVGESTSAGAKAHSLLFPVGSTAPVTHDLVDAFTFLPRGLALSADLGKAFGVMLGSGTTLFLAIDRPTAPPSSLTLATQGTGTAGVMHTFSGTLKLGDGASAAGQTIRVFRMPRGGTEAELASVSTDDTGGFTFEDAPSTQGTWTYRALWAGDDGHSGSQATVSLLVSAAPPPPPARITVTVDKGVVKAGAHVQVVAHVSLPSDASNNTVNIYMQPNHRPQQLLASETVAQSGDVSATLSPTKNTEVWATWDGDDQHGPAQSDHVTVNVRSKTYLFAYHDYKRSGRYLLFHSVKHCTRKTPCPTFFGLVVPNDGVECVTILGQERVRGRWSTGLSENCAHVHKVRGYRYRVAGIYIVGLRKGHTYRIRAGFEGGPYLPSVSRWIYYRITA
ncbi:MAG: YncE family protein [Actinomycetota bacterium]